MNYHLLKIMWFWRLHKHEPQEQSEETFEEILSLNWWEDIDVADKKEVPCLDYNNYKLKK